MLDLLMVDTHDIWLHGLSVETDGGGGRVFLQFHFICNLWLDNFVVFFQNLLIHIWFIDGGWLLLVFVVVNDFLVGLGVLSGRINIGITLHDFQLSIQLFLSFLFVFFSQRPWWIIVVILARRAQISHFLIEI